MKRPFLNQGERRMIHDDDIFGDGIRLRLAWNHLFKNFMLSKAPYVLFGIWLGVLLLGLLSLIGIKIYE